MKDEQNEKFSIYKNNFKILSILSLLLSLGYFYDTGYDIGRLIPTFNTLAGFDKFSSIFGIVIEFFGSISYLYIFVKLFKSNSKNK